MADSLDIFISGEWKAYCDVCGRELHASKMRKRWDGFMVCDKDWEMRNPQDFIRAIPERITPPWTRPNDGASFAQLNTVYTSGNTDPGTASLTALDVYIDTTSGAINWYLPDGADTNFFNEQVIYTVNNYAGTNTITVLPSVTKSNTLTGSATIASGTSGKFTNSGKDWRRIL